MRVRLSAGKPRPTAQRIQLYSMGVGAKLKEAEYALQQLSNLAALGPAATTEAQAISVEDKIHFYVDSFFAFSYSTLDVIAQVVNQAHALGLDERTVSFKAVKGRLTTATHPVLKAHFERISRTYKFRNMENYRNCSTHRRRIYIQTTTVQGTPGYSSTGMITSTKHVLCDDPLSLAPRVTQNRELVDYCTKTLEWIREELTKIAVDV